MAKRYYQSKAEPYANREVSKRMMKADGYMIHDDYSARSLLPQQVMQKEWPKAYNHMQDYYVEDLFLGVNKQLNEDGEGMKKAFGPGKY